MRMPLSLASLTRSRARRAATLVPVALLLATLGGDRTALAIVERGIDPLQVLDLYVRPNVIVVLDSSGSMTSTGGTDNTHTGDHPRSRLWQAKQVIRDVVAQNQSKVNFQVGTYTQTSTRMGNTAPALASAHGSYRFQYTTRTDDYPAANDEQMETGEATVMGDFGRTIPNPTPCVGGVSNAAASACDARDRGLQSWQIVDPGYNQLTFEERNATNTANISCTVTVTATKKFYREGGPAAAVAGGAPAGTLAADIEAAMNTQCTTGRANTYRVAYNANTGIFTISRQAGTRTWRPRWTLSTIRARFGNPNDPALGTGPFVTLQPFMLLIRRPGAADPSPPVGPSWGLHWRITEAGVDPDGAGPEPARTVVSHQLYAGAYFNGEVVRVDPNGTVCDVQFPVAPLPVPAKVTLQPVLANCGGDTGTPVDFTFSGANMGGNPNSVNCQGFMEGAGMPPCDQAPGDTQLNSVLPIVEREMPFNADGTLTDYSENAAMVATAPPATTGGARADGYTPIANSLIDIKTNFNLLWSTGQLACPAGPPSPLAYKWTVQQCPDRDSNGASDPGYTRLALDAISTHVNPKERTIVLFVTDGDDTCSGYTNGGSNPNNALRAAHKAQLLYARINAAEPASSVQTYVIGFGNGATPTYLNYIAWGGSGMVLPATTAYGADVRWNAAPTAGQVAACKASGGCQDAFIAPDANTLASYLQGIINQGAVSGEFVAQTPLITNVFEQVGTITVPANNGESFDARNPETRYLGFVPVLMQSSFVLPGFQGKMAAYVNDGSGGTLQLWEASAKLLTRLTFTAAVCSKTGIADQCTFNELFNGATDQTVGTAAGVAIRRRIYTTSRNGVFPVTTADMVDVNWMRTQGGTGQRLALWPPAPTVAQGYSEAAPYPVRALDAALGLPTGVLTLTEFNNLLATYRACAGTNLRADGCATTNTAAVRAAAARAEAREMILAYMAGAEWLPDGNGDPLRTPLSGSPSQQGRILYKARQTPLADGTYGTPAVISQPLEREPAAYVDEYRYYRDGGKVGGVKVDGLLQGFGVRNPDKDDSTCPAGPSCTNDGRATLKPRMTVVFQPANDMLHAFRAGGCNGLNGCTETGGEELWGFVPFDQLARLGSRLVNRPQRRSPHDYMISTGVRFADVFVPGALDPSDGSPTLSSRGINNVAGLWRRILLFGRGQGGKYLTALDVTSPGPFTIPALGTVGPIALWNRGNPDTQDGTLLGPKNNTLTTGDFEAYKLMGETWSTPTVSYVNLLGTRRKPCADGSYGNAQTGVSQLCSDQSTGGVPYVSFLGSGYGEDGTREGYALFSLDTLTGDVVAYADVEAAAVAKGWDRTGGSYPGYRNAIVSDPSGYASGQLVPGLTPHPSSTLTTRVYVGDLHGRAWKFVAVAPHLAIPFADLGADQPIGVGAALITPVSGLFPDLPHVYMIAGNETRAAGPFKLFGLYDEKSSDSDTSEPAVSPLMFSRVLQPADAGTRTFRGTAPPVTFFNSAQEARVVFAATRFNPPSSPEAPPVPPYPCRSSFDSIVYGLKAESGQAAYSLPNDGGAAQFIQNVRILALAPLPNPATGTATIQPIAGQVTSIPAPPVGGPAPNPAQTEVNVMPDETAAGAPALLFRNAASVCTE